MANAVGKINERWVLQRSHLPKGWAFIISIACDCIGVVFWKWGFYFRKIEIATLSKKRWGKGYK